MSTNGRLTVAYHVAADIPRAVGELRSRRDQPPARASPVRKPDTDTNTDEPDDSALRTDGGEIVRDDEVDHQPSETPDAPSWPPDSDDECSVAALQYDHPLTGEDGILLVVDGPPETDDAWAWMATADLMENEQ